MVLHWEDKYPNCPPVGFRLKHVFSERWIRFHCLPESKRYAENEVEDEVIRSRYRAVLKELTQNESLLWLVITECADTAEPCRSDSRLAELVPQAEFWRAVAMGQVDKAFDDDAYWQLFVCKVSVNDAVIDSLLHVAAKDETCNVLLIPDDCRWVFHPYDGGMDVILESSSARNDLRSRFEKWLSARSDGF